VGGGAIGAKDGGGGDFGAETYGVAASDLCGWANRVSTHSKNTLTIDGQRKPDENKTLKGRTYIGKQ